MIWDPSYKRLTDLGVIFALLTLHQRYRRYYLKYDFDARGHIRKNRVPRAPTAVLTLNNVRYLPVFKDTYILSGGFLQAGWLLGDSYPVSFKIGQETVNWWFTAGLVTAPPSVVSSPGLHGLDTTLQQMIPDTAQPGTLTTTWKWAQHNQGVFLLGRHPPRVLVLGDYTCGYATASAETITPDDIANFTQIKWSEVPALRREDTFTLAQMDARAQPSSEPNDPRSVEYSNTKNEVYTLIGTQPLKNSNQETQPPQQSPHVSQLSSNASVQNSEAISLVLPPRLSVNFRDLSTPFIHEVGHLMYLSRSVLKAPLLYQACVNLELTLVALLRVPITKLLLTYGPTSYESLLPQTGERDLAQWSHKDLDALTDLGKFCSDLPTLSGAIMQLPANGEFNIYRSMVGLAQRGFIPHQGKRDQLLTKYLKSLPEGSSANLPCVAVLREWILLHGPAASDGQALP